MYLSERRTCMVEDNLEEVSYTDAITEAWEKGAIARQLTITNHDVIHCVFLCLISEDIVNQYPASLLILPGVPSSPYDQIL